MLQTCKKVYHCNTELVYKLDSNVNLTMLVFKLADDILDFGDDEYMRKFVEGF